jgi:hypothetical protein
VSNIGLSIVDETGLNECHLRFTSRFALPAFSPDTVISRQLVRFQKFDHRAVRTAAGCRDRGHVGLGTVVRPTGQETPSRPEAFAAHSLLGGLK